MLVGIQMDLHIPKIYFFIIHLRRARIVYTQFVMALGGQPPLGELIGGTTHLLPTPGEAKAKAMPGRLYIHTEIK